MVGRPDSIGILQRWLFATLASTLVLFSGAAFAQNVDVTIVSPDATGRSIPMGFRWILEKDETYAPSDVDLESLALNMHKSYMPVVDSGHSSGSSTTITVPDPAVGGPPARYYLSVLPDQDGADCQLPGNCFTMSGKQITSDDTSVVIAVGPQPLPTAQAFISAYEDIAPINNVWDTGEPGLGGFTVFIYDMGGQLMTDVFGNPLGTVYAGLNADGTPRILRLGDGTIHTMTDAEVGDPLTNPYGLQVGEALIKNIAPGKYGIRVVPTQGEDWVQTSTIEGTPGQDVWIKAGEPRYFAEFGPAGRHADYGFVRDSSSAGNPGYFTDHGHPALAGTGSISGRIVNNKMSRPNDSLPIPYSFAPGAPLPGCWIGLNDATSGQGLYAAPCNSDSEFSIPNVPAGSYTLSIWDVYLDNIFNLQAVTVADGEAVALGDIQTFRWFGTQDHWVFYDENRNGIRDPGEQGIPEQVVNLRYRDGSIYQSSATDVEGFVPFEEIFPFFSWLVAEVDFARFDATGVTIAVEGGGAPIPGPVGQGKFNPQLQDPAENLDGNCAADGCLTRTELGAALTEGYNAFIGSDARLEWGKRDYDLSDTSELRNGGISGVVYYQTTRAEDDPRFAAPEPWEPGIPRVQMALYRASYDSLDPAQTSIDPTVAGDPNEVELADVDNYPFGWSTGGAMGPEDVNRNAIGDGAGCEAILNCLFDKGDALQITTTDSWDDNIPTKCPGDPADSFHNPDAPAGADPAFYGRCYDGLRNFNQIRPAVFDGGYAFGGPFSDDPADQLASGYYVVESSPPPHYLIQREQDKNVDFGDTFVPQALPPICVGDSNPVPAEHELFPGVENVFAGQTRPLCDRRVVLVTDGKNAASDFFMFTETPVTGHLKGFILNDLANEFDPNAPNFGEKYAPSFIPVSIRDYLGNEVYHTTSDKWGNYNAIVPSTYTINSPMASGVAPNMLQVCLNSPTREDPANPGTFIPDEQFNPQFTQFCYTFNFQPGQTTYLDTPVLPIAAYAGPGNWQLDCSYPDGTPMIHSVSNMSGLNGPVARVGDTILINSMGMVNVPDPTVPRIDGNNNQLDQRDFSFGSGGQVLLGGVDISANATWSADGSTIEINVDSTMQTGQLEIVRADSGLRTVEGVTLIVRDAADTLADVHTVMPGQSIQDAIDAAQPGDVVLVEPGVYQEMLIVTKPIQLQGAGAGGTIINPVQTPTEKIRLWREKVNFLANCSHQIGLLEGQPNNTGSATAPCGHIPGTGLFLQEEGPGVLVAPVAGAFDGTPARVDGFTITGADQSAGIIASGNTRYLEISNNLIANNQGANAAGIRIGFPTLLDGADQLVDASNRNVNIHHNHVTQNGGLFEAGAGVGLYTGSHNYRVTHNNICGNFAQSDGAGIAHYGLSRNGVIADNRILLNQAFDQTAGAGGTGGGILIAGHEPTVAAATQVSAGSGSVQILRNLIQGNQAGSGDGGGIALRYVNGSDVTSASGPNRLYRVVMRNNMIINNSTGLAGGGVSIQDALRAILINNTIANNDSTATAALAFGTCAGGLYPDLSCPQIAGVASHTHTPSLAAEAALNPAIAGFVKAFSDPVMVNNIIVGSRQHIWNAGAVTTTNGLELQGYRDVGVVEDDLALLTSRRGILSDPTGLDLTVGGNQILALSTTSATDALTAESQLFECPYFNGSPTSGVSLNDCLFDGVLGSATYVPGGEPPTILAAAAQDEGGNFIDVHFGPLAPVGDYHLAAGQTVATPAPSVTAVDFGATRRDAAGDYDLDGRPYDIATVGAGNRVFDIGADEVAVGTLTNGANNAPSLGGIPATLRGFVGVPFSYQVVAFDVNGDPLTFSLTMNADSLPSNPAPVINPSTGLISWTPAAVTTSDMTVTVSVSDGSEIDTDTFALRVRDPNLPVPTDDAYSVDQPGAFAVTAPGVLANDSNSSRTAQLESNVDLGGSVSMMPNGAFTYLPDPSFVGTATFTYRPVNVADLPSDLPGTVRLYRELAVLSAYYDAGATQLSLSGVSAISSSPGGLRTLAFSLNGTTLLGTADVGADGNWSVVLPLASIADGDTVQIDANGAGAAPFTLSNISILNWTAANLPQSTSYVQCPLDSNLNGQLDAGEGHIDPITSNWVPDAGDGDPSNDNIACRHLAAGDGYAMMADGKELYTFGFSDVTAQPANLALAKGILNAKWPAPSMVFDQGEEVYLTLSNAGMLKRPDLFDAHTVHFHGFPNAGSVFDGVPESSISINMGFSLTYYYNIVEPGTYMYHCHVEAAEHMQMGMLGNLYVNPRQNVDNPGLAGFDRYAYNDADGSTGYDVEKAIQIGSFDSNFHEQHIAVQPLPFAEMKDDYPMLNGRGYPDTVSAPDIPPGPEKSDSGVMSALESSQVEDSRVLASQGDRILLRLSNLNVTQFYTLATTGLTMQVVGQGAHILRGPADRTAQGQDLYYTTNSITLGGGEAVDVLIDTTGVPAGTYLLYSTNLNELSNGPEDFGGMMTEIVIQ